MRRIVIVGGSVTGVAAADGLRERGYAGDIVLVSAESDLPYDRPPLSKEVLLESTDPARLWLREATWYADQGISLLLETRASGLDPRGRHLLLERGGPLSYDALIVATGSSVRQIDRSTVHPVVHSIRKLQDAVRLRGELRPGAHLIIIGGGFIGLEVAAGARQSGLDVTVIEAATAPLARVLGDGVGTWYRGLHERRGVRFVCGRSAESVERSRGGVRVALSDGTSVTGDLVLSAAGAEPAVGWLHGSGLPIGDGILCAPDLSTPVPGVFAAGDVARWYNPVFDEEMRVEHWSNAVAQGRHVAGTVLGERDAFSSVPYFWSDQYEARMRFVGRADAAEQVYVASIDDDSLTVLYGRDGMLRGSLCVNDPRALAGYRQLIHDQTPWDEVIGRVGSRARTT